MRYFVRNKIQPKQLHCCHRLKTIFVSTTAVASISVLIIFFSIYQEPQKKTDVGLNTDEIIVNRGYICETHYITTEDDYVLTYQRIPHGISSSRVRKKPVALLMHGLFSSSADYVLMGPNRSLAYLLAHAGYDVWLGNSRGNVWSRRHVTLDAEADAAKFFNFSWHEMGYYDLPASIDYILNLTQQEALYYIGHSQGCTQFLVMASTRPEYNSKIKLASLMAPASFMNKHGLGLLKFLGRNVYTLESQFKKRKIFEVPHTDKIRKELIKSCVETKPAFKSKVLLDLVLGSKSPQLPIDLLPVLFTNFPSNAAVKQVVHFGQLSKNGGFSLFDYGATKNKELYGSKKPPDYSLRNISAPVAIYYSKNDKITTYQDALTLIDKLPNVVHEYVVPYKEFSHFNFIFAKDVVDLLYHELIAVMNRFSRIPS